MAYSKLTVHRPFHWLQAYILPLVLFFSNFTWPAYCRALTCRSGGRWRISYQSNSDYIIQAYMRLSLFYTILRNTSSTLERLYYMPSSNSQFSSFTLNKLSDALSRDDTLVKSGCASCVRFNLFKTYCRLYLKLASTSTPIQVQQYVTICKSIGLLQTLYFPKNYHSLFEKKQHRLRIKNAVQNNYFD